MLTFAKRQVRVIGHRGCGQAVENTLPAFRAALRAGVDAIETDVRLSSDGVAVLFHDADLTRMTGVADAIADLELARLARVDLGGGVGVPTLACLLELCRDRAEVILDLKIEGAEAAIAGAVAATGFPATKLSLYVWTDTQASGIRRHLPQAKCVFIADAPGQPSPDRFEELVASGFAGVSVNRSYLTRELVDRARTHGLTVATWTVNDADDVASALAHGVDDIITDDPAVCLAPRRSY